MQRVSTNLTLFYKFFIPVFWIIFFGALTTATFFYGEELSGAMPVKSLQIGTLLFFISGALVLALTLMRLKRVEMNEEFVYVTDYFRNFRYPWHNIEAINEVKFLFFNIVSIRLKTPGTFGKRMTFIASKSQWEAFLKGHPELAQAIRPEE